MFDFYKMFFLSGHLTLDQLKEAVQEQVLSKEEYKEITGKAYRASKN